MLTNKVRSYRLERGWSQEKLAQAANIGRVTISNVETGRYTPGVDIALLLAAALGCTVEDLFQLEEGV